MIKKFNEFVAESRLGRILNQSFSDDVRKEDEIVIEPTDLGQDIPIYWSRQNLVIDGKDKFTWDEIHDYKTKDGWRLPTREEVKLLTWDCDIAWFDDANRIRFRNIVVDGKRKEIDIVGDSILGHGFSMWTSEEDNRWDNHAYAYGFDNSYKFHPEHDQDYSHNKRTELYVFLVKDKVHK